MSRIVSVLTSVISVFILVEFSSSTLVSISCADETHLIENEDDSFIISKGKKSFGKASNINLLLGADGLNSGVISELTTKFFGTDLSLLEAAAKSTNLKEGEVELTLAGMKVFHQKGEFKNGSYSYSAGLPTTQSRLKVAAVPVGPVMVELDAGLLFEADLTGKVSPFFSLPIEFSTLNATLSSEAAITGFVEGYAQFLFLRAGIGGEVELIKGKAEVDASLGINALTRKIIYSGLVSTLKGSIYAFADLFTLFKGSWNRIWEPKMTQWKGYCYSLSSNKSELCELDKKDIEKNNTTITLTEPTSETTP